MLKKILGIIAVIIVIVIGVAVYMWNKPHRDVMDAKDIVSVSAQTIFDKYKADETAANKLYLDSTIQVSGEVDTIEKNQTGMPVIVLKTTDPMGRVRCTLKDSTDVPKDKNITIRGICQGYLMDVTITQAVQIKP
jgi:uncharacterized protein YpmB